MTYWAKTVADNAKNDSYNPPGYCLSQCADWAGSQHKYGTAADCWWHVNNKRRNRDPRRGAMVYWTGGSHGYGHIAVSLGGGLIRSTDAGGTGRVATVPLGWVEQHWGLHYAGWSFEINDQIIKHKRLKRH